MYSYLLNAIKSPDIYDIRAISVDFMTKISVEQADELNREVLGAKHSFRRVCKPKNEAQMHAVIYANLLETFHGIDMIMSETCGDNLALGPSSIVDYGCGLGLATLAMIQHFKTSKIYPDNIGEIILVEEDANCLERAELLVKSVLPTTKVKTINKSPKSVSPEDVMSECLFVYNLFCTPFEAIDKEFVMNVANDCRYLFSVSIVNNLCTSGFCVNEFNNRGYGIIKKVDFATVKIKQSENGDVFWDYFYEEFYSMRKQNCRAFDKYGDEISAFIKNRKGTPLDCYDFFKRLSSKSILAKINLAVCLQKGIGHEKDTATAIALLEPLVDLYEDDVNAVILRLMGNWNNDKNVAIGYYRKVLLLDIDESSKCSTRSNLAYLLSRREGFDAEVEMLYRQCIEHGCRKCPETANYDLAKNSCPKSQYWLSQLRLGRGEVEMGIQLMRTAAMQGWKAAQVSLGAYYYNGKYVKRDENKAKELFSAAANAGNILACRNLYYFFQKKHDLVKALWYLALACNAKDTKAIELMLEFLPNRVLQSPEQKELSNNMVITLAELGVEKYRQKAIDIIVCIGDRQMHDVEIENAEKTFNRLKLLDESLAETKLRELVENTPDDYYDNRYNDYDEPYTHYDSVMDALDGEVGAYWNID